METSKKLVRAGGWIPQKAEQEQAKEGNTLALPHHLAPSPPAPEAPARVPRRSSAARGTRASALTGSLEPEVAGVLEDRFPFLRAPCPCQVPGETRVGG